MQSKCILHAGKVSRGQPGRFIDLTLKGAYSVANLG